MHVDCYLAVVKGFKWVAMGPPVKKRLLPILMLKYGAQGFSYVLFTSGFCINLESGCITVTN